MAGLLSFRIFTERQQPFCVLEGNRRADGSIEGFSFQVHNAIIAKVWQNVEE